MKKESWTLLWVWTTYVEVHTFKWKDYVTVRDFSTTTNALSKEILELEEENKKLKEDLAECDDLREELDYRKREDKELRKWIKEHVDYQTQADFRKRFEHK